MLKHFRIDGPDRLDLTSMNCADTGGIDKDAAAGMLADEVKRLSDLQERLYAADR